MKSLTVAVPVYNTEKYLKRCFDSLLIDDVLEDLEIVAVNDGSRDGSLSILNDYAEMYPDTVRVIDKENGGHGSAVNAALECASGKYFRILDSDDWVASDDFVQFMQRIRTEDADAVITNYSKEFVYDGHTEKITWERLEDNKKYVFDEIDLEILNKEYFVMANTVYRTELLKRAGLRLMEKTFYVDMQYNTVPIPYVNNFRYYDLDIYRYFIGRPDQSMNLESFIRNRSDHERVMRFLVDSYTEHENELSPNKKEYIKYILYYSLTTHYNIHCVYPKKGSGERYAAIKAFDAYLKEKNTELYDLMNKVGNIRYNRKTKFIFAKLGPQFFSKLIERGGRILKRKGN